MIDDEVAQGIEGLNSQVLNGANDEGSSLSSNFQGLSQVSSVTLGTSSDDRMNVLHPRYFFGRQAEKEVLLERFRRVSEEGSLSRSTLVRGPTGTGKSSLVEQLRNPVVAANGYFVQGKWEQYQNNTPFSALVAAFSDLCDLISQADKFSSERQEDIQRILNSQPEGKIIQRLFPREDFFGPTAIAGIVDVEQQVSATSTVGVAFKLFAKALCHISHPIVIMLDDIQWADQGSVEVLRSLLTDEESRHILFVLCCRDDDERATHVLQVYDDVIQAKGRLLVNEMFIQDFSVETLSSFVNELSYGNSGRSPDDSTLEVAWILHRKTAGNALVLRRFLGEIHLQGMMVWEQESRCWQWDVQRIRNETDVADNILSLLERMRAHLTPETKVVLQQASCVGYRFAKRILLHIGVDESILKESLLEAERYGLVESLEEARRHFKFSHDAIQKSTYESMEPEERAEIHLLIAQGLQGDVRLADSSVCAIADHMNRASTALTTNELKKACMLANEQASQLAFSQADFFAASHYTKGGVKFMRQGITTWESDYQLCLQLHTVGCQASCSIGEFPYSMELTQGVVEHARSIIDKSKAFVVSIRARGGAGNYRGAVQRGLDILKNDLSFAVPASRPPNRREIRINFWTVKMMLKRRSRAEILALRHVQDERLSLISSILALVAVYASAYENRPVYYYCALRIVRLTLENGLTDAFPTALAFYSMLERLSGNIKTAFQCALLATEMQQKTRTNRFFCYGIAYVNMFVLHWQQPINLSQLPIYSAYTTALTTGQVGTAFWLASIYLRLGMLCHSNLRKAEEDAEGVRRKIVEYNHSKKLSFILPYLQVFQNLRDKSENPLVLTGDAMNEQEYLETATRAGIEAFKMLCYELKLEMACIFNDLEMAGEMLTKLQKVDDKAAELYFGAYFEKLYFGLTYVDLYRSDGNKKNLVQAKKISKSLERMEKKGCPNIPPLRLLMKAELMSFSNSSLEAQLSIYQSAIESAESAGFTLVRAVATERAGNTLYLARDRVGAKDFWEQAKTVYEWWGALAKVRHLGNRVSNVSRLSDTDVMDLEPRSLDAL